MTSQKQNVWTCCERQLDLSEPLVMGIVNVTPDSFSDGGLHAGTSAAVDWARTLVEQGADILDVGGESTRPGAAPVSQNEELDRVIPVVEALAARGWLVSVDTSKPEVMRESLRAGAKIINDIRSFELPGAVEAVAHSGAGLVIMHMQGTPQTMQRAPAYTDLVAEVSAYLQGREAVLRASGVPASCICWDPGFGFGKTVEQNFELLAATQTLCSHGAPVLIGVSRKSSIGAVTGVDVPSERVTGSVAAALLSVERGARIVRVHDVAATVQALSVWRAMTRHSR